MEIRTTDRSVVSSPSSALASSFAASGCRHRLFGLWGVCWDLSVPSSRVEAFVSTAPAPDYAARSSAARISCFLSFVGSCGTEMDIR